MSTSPGIGQAKAAVPADAGVEAVSDVTVKAASAWVNQFARTLKTCRLYDGNNPTVVRFRQELATALRRLVDVEGVITLRFTQDDVLLEDVSLYPAKSRDDNLALPFHRDGVRSLTFQPGIEPTEVDALVDSVLLVSGQNFGQDDLVTLLWEAHFKHVEMDYVPSEGDIGGGPGEDTSDAMPWPTGATDEPEQAATPETEPVEGEARGPRSDDWNTGELTVEVEAGFEELSYLAATEAERFRAEYQTEHNISQVTTALALAHAYLGANATAEDRTELGRFIPRLLRLSITRGGWLEARESLAVLRSCGSPDWSIETFSQELLQAISISSMVTHLDQQGTHEVLDFISFTKDLGEPAVDLLNLVLAESQQQRNRRMIAEAVAELCRENPERLAPWLSDPRWFVVRNVVHILGWIGGPSIVGLLKSALRHPEPRVRQEVVAALGQVEAKLARPLLITMLDNADSRLFCAILHQLSNERDTTVAQRMLAYLQDPEFEQRPMEERRAIYLTLSSTGNDEVLPELEAELVRGNWFSRNQEAHRQAIARCLARIGTPLARLLLERGAQSKRGPVRKACEDALAGFANRE
jgi:HEAT repeats